MWERADLEHCRPAAGWFFTPPCEHTPELLAGGMGVAGTRPVPLSARYGAAVAEEESLVLEPLIVRVGAEDPEGLALPPEGTHRMADVRVASRYRDIE